MSHRQETIEKTKDVALIGLQLRAIQGCHTDKNVSEQTKDVTQTRMQFEQTKDITQTGLQLRATQICHTDKNAIEHSKDVTQT